FFPFFALLFFADATSAAVVEIPGNGARMSGIGVIAGWKCPPNDDISVSLDGGPALPAATRLPRGVTVGACGTDGRNGWLIQYNYNLLGDGPHSVVVRQGGTPFASASFEVTTLGETFLRGRRALFDLPIFG